MPDIRDALQRAAVHPASPLDYGEVHRRGRTRARRRRAAFVATAACAVGIAGSIATGLTSGTESESRVATRPPAPGVTRAPEVQQGVIEGAIEARMPTAFAVTDDSLWAAAGGLHRIDATEPFPPAMVAQAAADEGIGVQYLAAGDGALWAANGSSTDEDPTAGAVARIDPRTGRTVAEARITTRANLLLSGLGAGGAGVWAVDGESLLQINETSAALARQFDLAVAASEVSVGATGVWVAGAGRIHRVDPISGELQWSATVGNRRGGIPMTAIGDQVWAASDENVVLFDESGIQLADVKIEGVQALSAVDHYVWAASTDRLYRITPPAAPGRSAVVAAYASFPTSFGSMAIAGGRAWVADEGTNQIRVIRLAP